MKKIEIFKIEPLAGTGLSAAASLVHSLMGVEWGDINSASPELIVTYDDYWIPRSGIASALQGIGITCKISTASVQLSNTAKQIESRAAQETRNRKQEYRRESLRSPKLVCGCC